jgi:hypothetical protein
MPKAAKKPSPRKETVGVRLDPGLLSELAAAAEKHDRTVGWLCRVLVEKGWATLKREKHELAV